MEDGAAAELPEDAIRYIFSKLSNRDIAVASTLSKSWNTVSMSLTTFSTTDCQLHSFRMIKDRLLSLTTIRLMVGADTWSQRCLVAAATCYRLSHLTLHFNPGFDQPFPEVFDMLSTCRHLATLSITAYTKSQLQTGGCQLRSLKKLTLVGMFIIPDYNRFCSAFPALEELWYDSSPRELVREISIESLPNLKKLRLGCWPCAFLRVKAPKLTSLTVVSVGKVHCEASAVVVDLFSTDDATEVICDAVAEIVFLSLSVRTELQSIQFPKLVKVRSLACGDEHGLRLLDKLPGAVRGTVEMLILSARCRSLGDSQALRSFSSLRKLKIVGLSPCQPDPSHLPKFKYVECIVKGSPALQSLTLPAQLKGCTTGDEAQLMEWLSQLQRFKPALVIDFCWF